MLDLLGQDFVADFFAVEELGAFRGVVDDLGDLMTIFLARLVKTTCSIMYLALVHFLQAGLGE